MMIAQYVFTSHFRVRPIYRSRSGTKSMFGKDEPNNWELAIFSFFSPTFIFSTLVHYHTHTRMSNCSSDSSIVPSHTTVNLSSISLESLVTIFTRPSSTTLRQQNDTLLIGTIPEEDETSSLSTEVTNISEEYVSHIFSHTHRIISIAFSSEINFPICPLPFQVSTYNLSTIFPPYISPHYIPVLATLFCELWHVRIKPKAKLRGGMLIQGLYGLAQILRLYEDAKGWHCFLCFDENGQIFLLSIPAKWQRGWGENIRYHCSAAWSRLWS